MREYVTKDGDSLDMICLEMDESYEKFPDVLNNNAILANYDISSLPKGLSIVFDDIEVSSAISESISLWD